MSAAEHGLIAVVGVSADASKYGHRIFRSLLNAGYEAEGVNPKGGFVLGRRLYTSLAELERRPRTVITVVPPAAAAAVIEECNALGIKNVWMQPGSESAEALEKAARYGIKAEAACFMVHEGIW